jgi:hypothetical protein
MVVKLKAFFRPIAGKFIQYININWTINLVGFRKTIVSQEKSSDKNMYTHAAANAGKNDLGLTDAAKKIADRLSFLDKLDDIAPRFVGLLPVPFGPWKRQS